MIILNIRGEKRRVDICKNYDVVPLAHMKLLNDRTIKSDAGQLIKDEYYIFSATSNKDDTVESIVCGMGAARHLLKLTGYKGLPIFNPLQAEGVVGYAAGNINVHNVDFQTINNKSKWDKTAKQLYNAIMWLVYFLNAKPDTVVFDVLDKVIKYKSYKPFDSRIKSVNTMIEGFGGKTLTEIIDSYRDNNEIRDELCNFDLLINRIEDINNRKGLNLTPMF